MNTYDPKVGDTVVIYRRDRPTGLAKIDRVNKTQAGRTSSVKIGTRFFHWWNDHGSDVGLDDISCYEATPEHLAKLARVRLVHEVEKITTRVLSEVHDLDIDLLQEMLGVSQRAALALVKAKKEKS
jgi:hypothetical protein